MAEEQLAALTSEAGIALGAGLAMGVSALAAAWSQGTLGSAAMGVVAERPEFEKNILIYIVLPEVLAVFGFLVAVLLWLQLGH
ncbi:MAG: ATPase [Candidatus Micrarchaeota archaeon]|nr:ATPase [Candidatus Micrarchaeota archaeon]MBU1682227.1 ATPase [Candidatus Micrarchaeota archaeon]